MNRKQPVGEKKFKKRKKWQEYLGTFKWFRMAGTEKGERKVRTAAMLGNIVIQDSTLLNINNIKFWFHVWFEGREGS